MLSKLAIDNYALIDKSVIDLHPGFTVITGETGSGKSIMLSALSLLMGARSDSKVMGDKQRKTIVEAVFESPEISLKDFFEEHGLDWDDKEIMLRREISPSGKSRGFINDTPVNLTVLELLTNNLLDIHSQHKNSLLNRANEQLKIIDTFGQTSEILNSYKRSFNQYVALRNKIKKLKERLAESKENKEFLMFRLEQLDKLKPKKGELEILEREAEILGDADNIKNHLSEAYGYLEGENSSALRSLQNATSILSGVDMDLLDQKNENHIIDRLNSIKVELKDIADTIEFFLDNVKSDPLRYEKIQKRIQGIYETLKRFKVKDEEELVDLHQHLKDELTSINGDNTDIQALENELKGLAKVLKEHADALSEKRKLSAEKFAETVTEKVRTLGLPNLRFEVKIEKGKMSAEGQDDITFICSFNKNHAMQPISLIASGGEISRVMLGIKYVMASKMQLPTIIFDEIDTGVSGEIANKMGHMMKDMSTSIQVLAVTHLPQVAALGLHHLKVYKADDSEKTVSIISELNSDQRIKEIAGMLSGTKINDVALENARILLEEN